MVAPTTPQSTRYCSLELVEEKNGEQNATQIPRLPPPPALTRMEFLIRENTLLRNQILGIRAEIDARQRQNETFRRLAEAAQAEVNRKNQLLSERSKITELTTYLMQEKHWGDSPSPVRVVLSVIGGIVGSLFPFLGVVEGCALGSLSGQLIEWYIHRKKYNHSAYFLELMRKEDQLKSLCLKTGEEFPVALQDPWWNNPPGIVKIYFGREMLLGRQESAQYTFEREKALATQNSSPSQ